MTFTFLCCNTDLEAWKGFYQEPQGKVFDGGPTKSNQKMKHKWTCTPVTIGRVSVHSVVSAALLKILVQGKVISQSLSLKAGKAGSKYAIIISWQSNSTSKSVWLSHHIIRFINNEWAEDTCMVEGGMDVLSLLFVVFIARLYIKY